MSSGGVYVEKTLAVTPTTNAGENFTNRFGSRSPVRGKLPNILITLQYLSITMWISISYTNTCLWPQNWDILKESTRMLVLFDVNGLHSSTD